MILTFINHQLKSFFRSRNKNGSIAGQIVLGFVLLYFLLVFIGLGFSMTVFLPKIFPNESVFKSFNGIILYYFITDLLTRLQLQEIPTLSIIPYLHLNIKKSKIIGFLNSKSIFSAFNLWPILLFFPFIFTAILAKYGWSVTIGYLVSILSLTLFCNFLILYLKRKSTGNIGFTVVGLSVLTILGLLDYFKVFSIFNVSNIVFSNLNIYPYIAIFFAVLAVFIFKINSNYLFKNLYTEELNTRQEKKVSTDYAFLNRFGKVGELAALELKLILRHKRSRSSVILGFLFIFYGFIFYKEQPLKEDAFGQMLFAAIFMTGVSIIIYGQYMFAWQSAHFDGLLVSKINIKDFIKAKFLLFTLSSTLITLLATFYGFLSPKLLLLHLAAYLYNIGFGTVIVLYLATLNYKRLDITKTASFNYQGTGATQWLLMFPYILIPLFMYIPFGAFNKPYWGLAVIGVFGLLMLIMRGYWVNYIVKKFEEERYKIAEGFRE